MSTTTLDRKKKHKHRNRVAAPTGSLDERAMLVHLSIGFWGGRKKDKKKTDEVTKQSRADDDAGTWWTLLIPSEAVKPIVNARLQAREIHLKYTLPWQDNGFRVLPAAMFMKYTAAMRAAQQEYRKVVDVFLAKYPGMLKTAPKRLGTLFQTEMLPAPSELADKYPWTLKFGPLPTAKDFRVDLGEASTAEIRKSIEEHSKAAMTEAMGDLWDRLHAGVEKIAERLADEDGVFRKSLLENVTELCELLPLMNVTDDPDLEEARRTIVQKLGKLDPEVVRKNVTVRSDTAKAASDILKKIESYRTQKK